MKKLMIIISCLALWVGFAACGGDSDDSEGEDTTAAVDIVPGEDTAAPGEDTAAPGEDTTEPPEDTTEPGEDTTEPPEDTTEPPEDTTEPGEDTTQAGAPFGSCDSQGMSHSCTESYGTEEGKDAIVDNAESTCTTIGGVWQLATPCTTEGLLATCTQNVGGPYEVVQVSFYYDEAGTTTGKQICDAVGGTWEEF